MKKILSFLALALAFTACQTDPAVESVGNDGLVDVVLTVDAPELGVTRADGDIKNGHNSAFGAIDFMTDADWANYDLRYILEVYDANDNGTGEPIYRERLVNCLDKYAPTTFALRLVPNRDYKFVVFADFVAEGNAELTEPADKLNIADLYYNTADLRNISAITTEATWGAMNEVRDAYFVSKNVTITTGLNETLTLTRPFAKLRVIATDLDYIAGYAAPGYVEIKYKNEKIYKSFNAVNGQLNTNEMTGAELEYAYNVSKAIPYSEGYDYYSTNQTLFTDYLLAVEGQQTTVNFEMFVYEDNTKAKLIHSQDFSTQIPIQRNHLTTIIGDLLTTQANITIEIDDDFVDEFVKGWGDDNTTMINSWEAGEYNNATGDYEFVVKGENDFKVTINGAAVSAGKLTAGNYVLAQDAEENNPLTFTVEALQANVTTRALAAVNVIGGDMKVAESEKGYAITLDLVLQFEESKDVRHAIYTYEGPIAFGKVLDTPTVEAAVDGNVITLTWNAVADATSYTVSGVAEMPVVTEETTYTFTGEYETEYTFAVVAVNDNLASQPYTIVVTTDAAPVELGYKLYFHNVAEWSKVYAHIWANEGEDLGLESVEWPGRELTETEVLDGETYYVFQLPATATGKTVNVVFNDGAGTQTKDLAGVVEGNLFFNNYVEPVAPSDVVLYLQPNANWKVDGARFAAYFFGNGETWVDMTLVEGETNIYAVTVPAGYPSVIFCRMNPGAAANNWTNKWNQTADLTVPTDGTNLYTVKEDTWDNGGGTWGVYAPAVEPEEPTALATPVVEAAVEGNVVTLTWAAIENAAQYGITVGTEMPVFVEGTTYVFTGEYETEYTFNVVAVPADEATYAVSEAAVVTATTEAAPAVEQTYTTVAEFLAADVDDATFYTLKGTITRVANTSYGNFDLTDETGTIYVYGLYSEDGATNKYWAASGAQLGDDIVISAVRADYNGSAQAGSARFLGLTSPGTLAFFTVSTNAVDFASAGGEQVIAVTAYNTDAAVTATSDTGAFAVSVNGYNVTVSAVANELEEKVTGNITIKVGDLAETVVKASLAAKPAAGAVEGGRSDFNTISATNTSYVSGKTTAGWAYTNCAIFKGGTSDQSPAFTMIGEDSNRALCMNGKTSAVGSITSPTITTGCGTLKFNYGLPFSDTKIKFTVEIIQNGETVQTFTVDNPSATKLTKYSFEESINVAGEFQIIFKNLSPSNSTSNKDRTAIWDVEWTGMN